MHFRSTTCGRFFEISSTGWGDDVLSYWWLQRERRYDMAMKKGSKKTTKSKKKTTKKR
jgi:hypothetical protein